MKKMNSHFELTKQQRNGILFLIVIIAALQLVIYFFDFSPPKNYLEENDLIEIEHKIDSLKNAEAKNNNVSLQPFNPNFLTDYRGYVLGMSTTEIDNILNYRKTGKWINSTAEFQKISGVSDSLMQTIMPFLKFPDWVNSPSIQATENPNKGKVPSNNKIDLNTATFQELKLVNGIGDVLAERIIKYRNTLNGGFAAMVELENVYGLKPEVIANMSEMFQIKTGRTIQKINLNTADRDQLVSIPFIDYELAHRIIEYRTLHEGFQSLDQLKSVKEFPENKFEQIKLYLQLN